MKILFDLVSTQFRIGGAQEYIRKIFFTLLDSVCMKDNIEILCAFDSSIRSYAYDDLTPNSLDGRIRKFIDLSQSSLVEIVQTEGIDVIFIGVAQIWGERYDVQKLNCKVVCVIHDLCDYEYRNDKIRWYLYLSSPWVFLKKMIRHLLRMDQYIKRMDRIVDLINNNPKSLVITVSNYSKYSIIYNLPINKCKIQVLYAPCRILRQCQDKSIENTQLSKLIDRRMKYFLMLSADRPMKNAQKAIAAFRKYSATNEDCYLLTVGYNKSHYKNHIGLPYLSESDLMHAYKNAYAFIFPSFFEGFGYPPLEAMRYGKPVLASYVTSIPEILGDAPIWFSPFYTTDIFASFQKLYGDNYESYAKKSYERYQEVLALQERDLERLIDLLVL